MTEAFLKPTILTCRNEKLIIEAFSEKNLNKIKEFNRNKRTKLKRISNRLLCVNDIFLFLD